MCLTVYSGWPRKQDDGKLDRIIMQRTRVVWRARVQHGYEEGSAKWAEAAGPCDWCGTMCRRVVRPHSKAGSKRRVN